jgi:hypothetical protein
MCSNCIAPKIGKKWGNMTQGELRKDLDFPFVELRKKTVGVTTFKEGVDVFLGRVL